MFEYLIVGLIVGAAGWYTVRKYVFKPKKGSGCGSGCSSCGSCESAPKPEANERNIIRLRRVS